MLYDNIDNRKSQLLRRWLRGKFSREKIVYRKDRNAHVLLQIK
jgi:hypothetical protein